MPFPKKIVLSLILLHIPSILPTVSLGNGIEVYGEIVKQILKEKAVFISQSQRLPTASTVAEVGYRMVRKGNYSKDLSSVRPIYLRQSDAEMSIKKSD